MKDFFIELFKYRKSVSNSISLLDKNNNNLFYNYTDDAKMFAQKIEKAGQDKIENIIPEDIKDKTLIDSLIDEAFSSAAIEGAYSTRKRSKDMIIKGQTPKNKSERMILNNYNALRYSMDNIDSDISHENIYSIWSILTKDTLKDEDICEQYRTGEVFVRNKLDDVVFEDPSADKLYKMMDDFIVFYNAKDNINPIVKACLIHYYFVYTHPFFDGNGRTARALVHIYLLKNGYDFLKYFAISKILVDKRNKYYEVIRDCEDNHSDVTYFIDFYTKLLFETIYEIRKNYLYQFSLQLIQNDMEAKNLIINNRQTKCLKYFLKVDKTSIDIKGYTKRYKVTEATARLDLNELVDYGLFKKSKLGKKYLYTFNKLDQILENLEKF